MVKYKIAYMPGDGIGKDVLEAARVVLDATSFDAEYIPLDIGFDIFKSEGDPLPDRTVRSRRLRGRVRLDERRRWLAVLVDQPGLCAG